MLFSILKFSSTFWPLASRALLTHSHKSQSNISDWWLWLRRKYPIKMDFVNVDSPILKANKLFQTRIVLIKMPQEVFSSLILALPPAFKFNFSIHFLNVTISLLIYRISITSPFAVLDPSQILSCRLLLFST